MKATKKLIAFIATFLMVFSNGFTALPAAMALSTDNPTQEFSGFDYWLDDLWGTKFDDGSKDTYTVNLASGTPVWNSDGASSTLGALSSPQVEYVTVKTGSKYGQWFLYDAAGNQVWPGGTKRYNVTVGTGSYPTITVTKIGDSQQISHMAVFFSEPKGGFKIRKVFAGSLGDVSYDFTIHIDGGPNNSVHRTIDIDVNGNSGNVWFDVNNLPYGTYTITEDSESGYQLVSVINDETGDNTVNINSSGYTNGNVTVTNQKVATVKFIKNVAGVHNDSTTFTFNIAKWNGSAFVDYTTVDVSELAFKTLKLPEGKYKVTEANKPGYNNDSITDDYGTTTDGIFEITATNYCNPIAVTVTAVNSKVYGSIEVTKGFTGAAPANGTTFTFQLFENGSQVGADKVLTWGQDGNKITFPGLEYGHTYYVKEVAKTGFDIDPDFAGDGYAVTINSPLASINCDNTKLFGSIEVTKAFTGAAPADGTTFTFQLFENGSQVGADKVLTWGQDGNKITFPGLEYGHTYTVKEVAKPGFTTDPDFVDGVSATIGSPDGQWNFSFQCDNTSLYGSISLHKEFQGVTSADPDDIFEVKIEGVGNNYSQIVQLKANGEPVVKNDLPWGGKFKITEINIPAGYALVGISGTNLNEDDTFQLTDDLASISVTVTNKMLGSMNIKKVVSNYTTDETFYVKVVGKVGDTVVYSDEIAVKADDTDGVDIGSLPYGDYTVSEDPAKIPANYRNVSITHSTFTIDNTTKSVGIVVRNEAIGSIRVQKLDSRSTDGNPIPVPGTHFEIYYMDGGTKVMVDDDAITDDDGEINIHNLLVGVTYYAHETIPAPGYSIVPNDVRQYVISAPGAVATAATFVNDPIGRIEVEKRDSRTEQLLGGFKFGLYPTEADALAGTNLIEELTTSSEAGDGFGKAVSSDLVLTGDVTSFWVKELAGLPGYQLNANVYKVDIAFQSRLEPASITVNNDPLLKVMIYKYDAATVKDGDYTAATKLAGAKFGIFMDEAATVRAIPGDLVTAVDPDTGDIYATVTLPFGGQHPITYWVKEVAAPDGYILDPSAPAVPVTFIEGDPLTTFAVARFANVRNIGSIMISKIDALTLKPLAGAEFTLYADENATVQVGSPVTTGADGIARFDNLTPGNYWIKETKAPKDYEGFPDALPVKVVGGVTEPEPITITNQYNPPEDIQTGMMDWNVLLLGGLALMAGVMLVIFTRKRRATSIR